MSKTSIQILSDTSLDSTTHPSSQNFAFKFPSGISSSSFARISRRSSLTSHSARKGNTFTVPVLARSQGNWAGQPLQTTYPNRKGKYGTGEGAFLSTGLPTGDVFRSSFTFDLPKLQKGEKILEATLFLKSFATFGDPVEYLGLFDVTNPRVIFAGQNVVNPSVYSDLGTGKSYGKYRINTFGTKNQDLIKSFGLNRVAIQDINKTASKDRSFSIGASLVSLNDSSLQEREVLFSGSSGSYKAKLFLKVKPTQ